ncbi:MAG: AAA family ATPase, partial [Proteobacteria bacterium]|nr:AAA family ATPase [Pseudomonadota bacterium]
LRHHRHQLDVHQSVGLVDHRQGRLVTVSPAQEAECWAAALRKDTALDWTEVDYKTEWDAVILFHGITTRDAYFKASRAGSPKTLKRAERAAVWEGLAAYRAELDRRKLVDWTDVVRKVRQHIEQTGATQYRAIVVDEAQDIDPEQWRLLRVLAPQKDNSLFITGDAHQRIYGRPIALSHFGINIRGRSYRLKINYRTTEQVLRWATKLLAGVEVDDLDGDSDSTVGYRSLYTGPEPDLRTFASSAAETAFLLAHIRELTKTTPPEEIAVVAKTKQRVNAYAAALDGAAIAHTILDGDSVGPGVRVATMHRVKGLDFTHVIMHMTKSAAPTGDPRDQSILYVAATRCRRTLTVLVS